MHWQKVTVVGVGLLGGSLGLAIKKRRLAKEVVGFVRRPASITECRRTGAMDFATRDLRLAVRNADLVILCTPIGRMRELAGRMAPSLKRGAIVTDVGSVKTGVVQALEPLLAATGAHFVGSHPMAGSERTGVRSARADLFEGAACVITPTRRSDAEAVRCLGRFWRSLGARVLRLPPETHDELVSRSSHLPHVVAAELANYVLHPRHPKEQALLCANGFRDTTRIASGSPEMWRDIALANRRNLALVLQVYAKGLKEFQRALENGDERAIEQFFKNARRRREAWSRRGTSRSPE